MPFVPCQKVAVLTKTAKMTNSHSTNRKWRPPPKQRHGLEKPGLFFPEKRRASFFPEMKILSGVTLQTCMLGAEIREGGSVVEIPSDTKLLLTKNYSEIIICVKLRISYVIP